jgi:hypothetical protein
MSFLGTSGTFPSATPRLIEHSIAFTFGRDPYWRNLLFTQVPRRGVLRNPYPVFCIETLVRTAIGTNSLPRADKPPTISSGVA